MYKLLIVFALVGVIIAAPSQRDEIDDEIGSIRQCFNDMVVSFEEQMLDELRETIADAHFTIGVLLERRQRCEELPMDDPPTRPQLIALEACRNAWRMNVATELTRLTIAFNQHLESGRDLLVEFIQCSWANLPRPRQLEFQLPQRSESAVDEDLIAQCLNRPLEFIETGKMDQALELNGASRQIFADLIEQRRRCNELPRDDPPTRPQEISFLTCENVWRLNAVIDLSRVSAALSSHADGGRDLISDFSECSGFSL
ncbi:uncharacterized protein LOC131438236 [Malaya genurostris]|uniref:uncharacterized protein LOC131438236 n=1 Tax=Malaya genurostris TaxID=325434 RepID=UPI0026F3AB1F|nr:uncharacterized protein LOC131438236 [Malaya genurostris]